MDKNIFKILKDRVECLSKKHYNDIFPDFICLQTEFAVSGTPVSYEDRLKLQYRPIREGGIWGKAWDSAWFHLTGTVPESFAGKEICLRLNSNSELMVFDGQGIPLCGLTGRSIFDTQYFKDCCPLKTMNPGERIDVWCEAAANGLFGIELPSNTPCPAKK